MWPFRPKTATTAMSLLEKADETVDDITYAQLVCEAAELLEPLDISTDEKALAAWQRIASLDGNRARMHELIDHARTLLQGAGYNAPATINQEYSAYLSSLPPDQQCLTQVRYLHRVVMSGGDRDEMSDAATQALQLLADYEKSKALTKKQLIMKLAFSNVLQRNA
jgi:hypothetical protein